MRINKTFLNAMACALAGVLIATLAYVVWPRTYRSEAMIAIISESSSPSFLANLPSGLGGVAALAGLSPTQGQSSASEISLGLLRADSLVRDFIAQQNLLPRLYPDEEPFKSGIVPRGVSTPSLNDAARKVREDVLRIAQDSKTGLVTVAWDWPDPEESAALLTSFIYYADLQLRQRENDDAEASLSFLKDEISKAESIELKQSLFGLVEGQLKRKMLATTRRNFAFEIIDRPTASDPDDPFSPNLVSFLIAGLVAGLAAPIAFGFLTNQKKVR